MTNIQDIESFLDGVEKQLKEITPWPWWEEQSGELS